VQLHTPIRRKRSSRHVSLPLLYVDTSHVREGAVEELKGAISELAAFVDANEPQLLAYSVYLSEDERHMTVVQVHANPQSLDYHLEVAGPAFARFQDLLTLSSIRVYGEPSERARERLLEKARLLGCNDVSVHSPHAGFGRFAHS
jgi:hypothetical protein